MAKPEWGMKRSCLSCGAKFYDLQNDPIICPKCETVFDPDSASKLKRNRSVVADKVVEKKAPELESEDPLLDADDLDDIEDGGDEDILEDTDDLGGDDVPVVSAPTSSTTNDSGDDI